MEVLGNKSMKFETNKWQRMNSSGIDEIPERFVDHDEVEDEPRDDMSDTNDEKQKPFKSMDNT